MNADHDPVLDEELAERLLAYDEALAEGGTRAAVGPGDRVELRGRLERGLACVQLLQRLRPRPAPQRNSGGATSILRYGVHAEAPPAAEPSCPVRIGRFEVLRVLGSGGCGIVYLAHDPALCREVALKIPRAGVLADAEGLARFQREARAAAGLDHPNLVPVHEAGQIGPVCYIALAYCPGSNLSEWLKLRTTPVACDQAARLVLTLAQAIHYAHGRGVLHRDLKPSNVLLSPVAQSEWPSPTATDTAAGSNGPWQPEPETGFIPRIADFGLARLTATDQGQTQTGDLLGTPCYMAPEQAEGRAADVGPATDVYALGAILYEVVTGRPPFWADTPVALLWQVKTTEPVAPGRLRPQMPRDLETICLKCLRKEPRRRYGSAEALAADLRRFLAGKPIQARPTSWIEQAVKWARRRPALAAALGALVVVTALGVGGVLRQWLQTQDALADEAAARRRAELLQIQAQEAQQAETTARGKSEVALYHHRVVLAHREWLAANVGRASQLLDECPVELRDWEWRYVRRLCDNDLGTLRGHSAPVMRVVFSPDGRQLASVAGHWMTNEPGEVKLWDAATGQLLWTGLGHTGPVMGVAFSPDGRQLASSSVTPDPAAGEIKIWETASGSLLQTLSFPGGAFSVAFSPAGGLLASGGLDYRIRIWDPVSGKQLARLDAHRANAFDVAFSADGRLLGSASWDGTACVWDVPGLMAEMKKPSNPLKSLVSDLLGAEAHKAMRVLAGPKDLRSVAFSPNGTHVVTASYDQSVKIWDVASAKVIQPYYGHAAAVLHATFSPDGRWVASCDTAGKVHVWNAQTGRLCRTICGHTGAVGCVTFSPEGRRLATAGADRIVRIWDFTREQEALQLEQSGPTRNVVFSPDGKLLAAAGYRHSSGSPLIKTVRLWSVDDFARLRPWEGHKDWVTCVAFSPDGKLLASGSNDRTIRLWDVATGKTLHTLAGHQDMVTGVSFSNDGRRLASASLDRTVRLWEVASGQLLGPVLTHPHPVHDVVYLRDGRRLVAVGDHGMILVWDVETGTEVLALRGHRDTVERALLSPDGRLLATAGRGQTVRVWDMTKESPAGEEVVPVQMFVGPTDTELITGLSFSADGRRLASSGRDHSIRIWDIASGNETLTLRGNLDYVNGMAFSPDGRLLASASTRNIKIWETADANPAVSARQAETAEHAARAWHWQQVRQCQAAQPADWFGVAFHLGRLLEAAPEDWHLRLRRAAAEMELGHWEQAVDDCTRSIALGATDPWPWFLQAVACLRQGDLEGYRRSCADLLERFGKTVKPDEANTVAWTCALAPTAVTDLEQVVRLARQAAQADPGSAAYHNTLGAILYRADQFAAARASLKEAMRLSRDRTPEDWLFLAMICQRQGETAEARRWLDKAVRWHDAARNNDLPLAERPQAAPCRLTEIELLRREAEALLAQDGGSEATPVSGLLEKRLTAE